MVTGWKTLPYGKDLRAARDGLQLQGGSWNRSRGENLARFVGGRQAGAHLHVAGDRSKVKGGIGKPPHVSSNTRQTQSLSPIPASGEGNSRFRRQVGEFLKQVSLDRFCFLGRSEWLTSQTAQLGG
jgi:hypothetical protein